MTVFYRQNCFYSLFSFSLPLCTESAALCPLPRVALNTAVLLKADVFCSNPLIMLPQWDE